MAGNDHANNEISRKTMGSLLCNAIACEVTFIKPIRRIDK